MGLSADPNKTIKIPKTKDIIASNSVEASTSTSGTKRHVVNALEREACQPQEKTLRLSEPEVRYCTFMMDKYGDDYKAMARDHKNYYQDTPKQIRRKINVFKSIPAQYELYVKTS